MSILYPLEVLTQLIPESSTPFKIHSLKEWIQFKPGPFPFRESWGWSALHGSKSPRSVRLERLLDSNTCDGSSCQLESPELALFLSVQEEVPFIPCLCLFHFPQYKPFINLGNASNPLENISHLIHTTVVSRAEKWLQMPSVSLEVNVRLYTPTHVLPSCLLLLKDKNLQGATFWELSPLVWNALLWWKMPQHMKKSALRWEPNYGCHVPKHPSCSLHVCRVGVQCEIIYGEPLWSLAMYFTQY